MIRVTSIFTLSLPLVPKTSLVLTRSHWAGEKRQPSKPVSASSAQPSPHSSLLSYRTAWGKVLLRWRGERASISLQFALQKDHKVADQSRGTKQACSAKVCPRALMGAARSFPGKRYLEVVCPCMPLHNSPGLPQRSAIQVLHLWDLIRSG